MPKPRRCVYCGLLYAVDSFSIEPHPCPQFRVEPPLPPIDPDFKVIPDNVPNSADGMTRYRRYLASHFSKE